MVLRSFFLSALLFVFTGASIAPAFAEAAVPPAAPAVTPAPAPAPAPAPDTIPDSSDPAVQTPIFIPFSPTGTYLKDLPRIGIADSGGGNTVDAVLGFKGIVQRVLLFVRVFLGSIALYYLFIAGYSLVTAGSTITEEITKQKSAIMYILLGLVLVTISEEFVNLFYNPLDSARMDFITSPDVVGGEIAERIAGIIRYFLSFVGSGAILVLVLSSVRLVINPGSEEETKKQQKVVAYTATGIVMIALSDTLINTVVFPNAGYSGIDIAAGTREIVGLSNYILGFMAVILLIIFIIAGFMLIVYYGDEQKVTTAKNMVMNSVIGAVVAYSAYTIVSTIVNILG